MTLADIRKLDGRLPKWPQMLVTGTPVTKEQAMEIVFRTDTFFSWHIGNDHSFIHQADHVLGMPKEAHCQDGIKALDSYYNKMQEYRLTRKYIETEYVTNSWISCSFIGGPHGWCHPDGTIGFADNVGKWPTIEEIYHDWEAIANAFPFLELEVTLMDSESDNLDSKPVISMLIRNGKVTFISPEERNIHEEFHRTKAKPNLDYHLLVSGEHAISLEELKTWNDWYEEKLKKEG